MKRFMYCSIGLLKAEQESTVSMSEPSGMPLCVLCKRLRYPADYGQRIYCEAFPRGIPASIIERFGDHRQPIAGDNGIRFELADRFTQQQVDFWHRNHARRKMR